MSSNQKKKVVIIENDVPVCIFDCAHDAALAVGLQSSSGVRHRILKNHVVNGIRFRFLEEGEVLDVPSMPPAQRKYRKTSEIISDEEISEGRYHLIPYEVKYGRVCITPCPLKPYPKPMVGSSSCKNCPSHRGRHPQKQVVICKRKNLYEHC